MHGTAVPIVDLRRLLPAGVPPRTAKPKVILARIGRRRVGLRVDGMAGVRRYTEAEIRPGGSTVGVLGVTSDECRPARFASFAGESNCAAVTGTVTSLSCPR